MTDQQRVEVDTANGRIRGVLAPDGGLKFLGIRYGQAPVGSLRFRPPQPVAPHDGVLDALMAGPVAPQNPSIIDSLMGGDPPEWNEDCLFLNVYSPGLEDPPRPVMVWIHGGGFDSGSGSMAWYDASRLAARGAVVVTLNYRLGVFGFLGLGALGDQSWAESGNLGLLDQIEALRWVQRNVAAFGGDPDNVTVFGESAGAMSIAMLMGIPAANGLFHRAILQSGACANVMDQTMATERAQMVLNEVGIDVSDLERLRRLPAGQLLAAQLASSRTGLLTDGLPFMPVLDCVVLGGSPLQAIREGSAAAVDVLIGTNRDEMRLFMLMDPDIAGIDEVKLERRMDAYLSSDGRLPPGHATSVYRTELPPEASTDDVWCAALTDYVFRMPAIRLAEAQTLHASVYLYRFTFATESLGGVLGSCHALDVPFTFDNLDGPGVELLVGDIDEAISSIARNLADAWVAFATTGQPAIEAGPDWPRYDTARRPVMEIDRTWLAVDDPLPERRRLWDGQRAD